MSASDNYTRNRSTGMRKSESAVQAIIADLLDKLAVLRKERAVLETAFCDLHRKAQTLTYEITVRPQAGEDWEPVRRAADELATELCENMPVEASREGTAR